MAGPEIKTKKSRRKKDAMRKRPHKSTPEAIAQYERLLGRKWRGNQDGAHESALSILCDRGYITPEMRDKGQEFAALFCTFFPIHAKVARMGNLPGKGSIDVPVKNQDERLAHKEARFRHYRAALMGDVMSGAFTITVNVAVKGQYPAFLNRLIELEELKRNQMIRQRNIELNNLIASKKKSILQQNVEIRDKYQRLADSVRVFVDLKPDVDVDVEMRGLKAGLAALLCLNGVRMMA